jgi:hypothetical protein
MRIPCLSACKPLEQAIIEKPLETKVMLCDLFLTFVVDSSVACPKLKIF